MKRIFTLCIVLAVACSLISIGEASATPIDSFDFSATFDETNPGDGFMTDLGAFNGGPQVGSSLTSLSVMDSTPTGAIAGQRDAQLNWTSGSAIGASVQAEGIGGVFEISSGTGNGNVFLEYDGIAGFGGIGSARSLGLDMSGDSAVLMDMVFFNAGFGNGETVKMTLEDTAGLTDDVTVAAAMNLLLFDLSGIVSNNIVDLANIDRILFDFQVSQGTDIQVDLIESVAIPEPGSIAIWTLVGLIAWISAWRLKRRTILA